MATNDKKQVVLVDNRLVEGLIWQLQEDASKQNILKTLSYGQAGQYAVKFVLSDSLETWRMGELMTGKRLGFYMSTIASDEEVTGMIIGVVSGESKSVSQKAKLDLGIGDIFDEFLTSITVEGSPQESSINLWMARWRLAVAVKTGFVSGQRINKYRKLAHMDDDQVYNFVLAYAQDFNPTMLRKAWLAQYAPVVQPAKSAKKVQSEVIEPAKNGHAVTA